MGRLAGGVVVEISDSHGHRCQPLDCASVLSLGLAHSILVELAADGTRISGNHLSGADVGIYQYGSPNCCRISENTLTEDTFFGIVIQDGDATTSKNSITGGQVGIGVVAGGADTVGRLRDDHITGTIVAPVGEIQCCGFTATAIVTRG